MTVPPKYSPVYEVESSSGDPHLSGPLQIRLSANGVSIRWAGETAWKEIAWYEIAVCAEAPGGYRDVIDGWKIEAFEEGLSDGVEADPNQTVLSYAEQLKKSRDPLPRTAP